MDHTSLWMFGLLLGLQIPWLALLMNHLNSLHLCFLFWLFRDAFRIHWLSNWWIFLAVNMFKDAQLKDPLYQGHIFPAVFAVFYLSDITTFCKVVPRGLCGLLCNFRCLFALKLKLDGATLILFCMYHPSVLVWGECLLQLQCSIVQRTFVHSEDTEKVFMSLQVSWTSSVAEYLQIAHSPVSIRHTSSSHILSIIQLPLRLNIVCFCDLLPDISFNLSEFVCRILAKRPTETIGFKRQLERLESSDSLQRSACLDRV